MIRILIAEDSNVVAQLLKAIINHEVDMEVIGRARNGREAVYMVNELKPDLVTMDIRMPEMDGFHATKLIMSSHPLPIVVISSSVDDDELGITFRAIEEGALAVLEKPRGLTHPEFEKIRAEIIDTIRAMADVRVVRRRLEKISVSDINIFERAIDQGKSLVELVVIGVSTGGPAVLQQLLSVLPVGLPVPIVITQHISPGFIGGLVSWLRSCTLLDVKCAQHHELLKNGTVYFAPDGVHLTITRSAKGLVAYLSTGIARNGFCPSISVLMESVANVCGNKAVGALLTGMGCDGASGLLAIRQRGGHTIVQDEESSVVYGMPGAAIALNAVDNVVKLQNLPSYLLHILCR